jgi:hypothetical protein
MDFVIQPATENDLPEMMTNLPALTVQRRRDV